MKRITKRKILENLAAIMTSRNQVIWKEEHQTGRYEGRFDRWAKIRRHRSQIELAARQLVRKSTIVNQGGRF